MNGLTLSLILLLACSSNSNTVEPAIKSSPPDGNTPTQSPSASASQPVKPVLQEGSQTMGQNMDQGQQHPPLPADNPAWDWDAQSFVPDFGWYGEHSWTDVRMRVVGHMAMAYRDLARIHILQEDWNTAMLVYQEMIQTLQAVDTASSKFAEEIRMVLLKSAERDVQILRALHTKADFPEVSPDALMHWRIEYWKLIQTGAPYDQQQISQLKQEIQQRYTTTTVSPIDEFENFTDRHKLRTELFNAYTQALDPILPTDLRWGYWRPAEIQRQAGALLMALDTLTSDYTQPTPTLESWWILEDSSLLEGPFYNRINELHGQNPIFTPSYFSHRLRDQKLDLSPEQLGRLPTGDSIIDVGGQPGPMGIGTLMKLDVSDPDHNTWLTSYASRLSSAIQSSPKDAVDICQEAIEKLDAYDHGSRFYNVKQFRNGCTRQLARLGHYEEALSIFNGSFPLHHQDWACPNREGLLLVIVGRLEMSAGDLDSGTATLQRSIQSSKDFLEKTEQAEQGLITTPKPPMMGGHGGGPPNGHRPSPQKGRSHQNIRAGVPPTHSPHKANTVPDEQRTNPPAR